MAKAKQQLTSLQIFISGVTVNGKPVPDVNYQRVTYEDGTVEEIGEPPKDGFAAELSKSLEKLEHKRKGRTRR